MDWQYKTEPNGKSCLSSINKSCRFSRGKCLGGSTSINAMMYTRGTDKDFEVWDVPNWTWEDMMPYFLRYEGLRDIVKLPLSSRPYHNTTGIMNLEFAGDSGNIWHELMFKGFDALNFPRNPDVNALSQIGVTQVTTYTYDGRRMSTARAYLTNTEIKSGLYVAKNTLVTKVIFDNNGTAIGVDVVAGIIKRKISLYVEKEVILSAGTIGSAHILLSSGIGPADHLKKFNISVHSDLPVGNNMTDHVLPIVLAKAKRGCDNLPNIFTFGKKGLQAVNWLLTKKGPLASIGLTDVAAFCNTECYDYHNHTLTNNGTDCNLPNMQVVISYLDKGLIPGIEPLVMQGMHLDKYTVKQMSRANVDNALILFTPIILRPKSKGLIRLSSSNPEDPPKIYPNYLDSKVDLDQMLQNIKIIKDLVRTPVMKKNGARLLKLQWPDCPEDDESDAYWRCYAKHMTYSVFHAVGTAALGSVVDWRLRVLGVQNLRVADASVVPVLPRGNTAALIIAIGERVADFVLEDNE